MADADKRGAARAPIVLRIRLRYPDVDTFIDKFSTNLSETGMFISTRSPRPPGTEVKFDFVLADDSPVIRGMGVVRWVREQDPEHPRRPYGMGVEFTNLDDQSRAVIERVIAHKHRLGVADHLPAAPAPAPAPAAAKIDPRGDDLEALIAAAGDLSALIARARAETIDDPELVELLVPASAPRAASAEAALAELRALLGPRSA
ncbi:MAG TPA: TIGR02266 family protein [Kofleriaceae bacterium]|nr:TIGR02266 family protein [Kofleriaceae bacterium]